jgi:small conductance mechanosensitive channel
MKIFPKMVLLAALLAQSLASFAQTAAEPGTTLPEMLDGVHQGMVDLRELTERIETVPERFREPLEFRRDEHTLRVMERLDALVRKAAELPVDDPQRRAVEERLQTDLVLSSDTIATRMEAQGQKIEQYSAAIGGLSGQDKVATRAFVASLESLRLRYSEALVDLIEGRRALGLPEKDVATKLEQNLYIQAESLSSVIEFTGSALDEIREQQKIDPDNADLAATAREMSMLQKSNLDRLRRVVALLKRLDQPVVSYQGVLLRWSQGLSFSNLEKDALSSVIGESWKNLRESVTESAPDVLFNLAVFAVIIFFFRAVSRLARRGIRAACERPGVKLSTLLKDTLESIIGGAVMAIGILMALSQIGIALGPMLAGLGVAGFIVGFALQDTLGNFASGAMILLYRPYDVDDFVEVAGATGFVKKMSLVSTTIATVDNQVLVVPNSKIWGDVIKNVTAQKVRRVDMIFGIGYGDDIAKAEQLLQSIVDSHEKVLKKPEALIKVHELGDSSVNLVVRPWTRTEDYWNVYWDVTREAKLRFDQEGITIPFPQRDVHVYNAPQNS